MRSYRFFLPLLLLTFGLGACAPSLPSPDGSPLPPVTARPAKTELIETSPAPPSIEPTLSTPPTEPSTGNSTDAAPADVNCGYQWAYQDLPELSTEFQQAIQALQPDAQASAYVFGEDCMHADGSRTFLARETDFTITLAVNDVTNESELGGWIVNVMQVILNIPKEQITGPMPGMVSIIFQAGDNRQPINFSIDRYKSLPPGSSNAEIYRALKTTQ